MIKVHMVFWSEGPDFQFKLFFQKPDAEKFLNESKVKKSDNHRMMEIELHGMPDLFACTHDDDTFRHVVFLNKDLAEDWLVKNDSGHMDVHRTFPGQTI